MKLYEPFSLTYLLITALIFAFSGGLFDDLRTKAQRDCYKANAVFLEEGKQGPLRGCE